MQGKGVEEENLILEKIHLVIQRLYGLLRVQNDPDNPYQEINLLAIRSKTYDIIPSIDSQVLYQQALHRGVAVLQAYITQLSAIVKREGQGFPNETLSSSHQKKQDNRYKCS